MRNPDDTELLEIADALHRARELVEHRPDPDLALAARLTDIELALRALRSGRPRRTPRIGALARRGLQVAVPLRQFGPDIGGAGVYTRNVLRRLASDHRVHLTIFTTESQVETLRETVPSAVFRAVPEHSAGLSVEHQIIDGERFDAIFCPLNLLDPPVPRVASVLVIYDIAHELNPDNFSESTLELRRRTYKPGALAADVVVTCSDHAKRTLVETFALDPGKVVVARGGVAETFSRPRPIEPSESFRELALPDDYLYYPANFWPHKNHANLLLAFELLLRERPSLALVLTGAPGPDADRVMRLANERQLDGSVRMLGLVAEELVCELMRHARAVPFVSQFEGFGLPIAEAFSVGTPVVTSLAQGVLETGGDAVLSAPGDDPAEIARQLARVLDDPALARELALRGRQRAAQFTWEQTAATIAGCIEQAIQIRRSQAASLRKALSPR